MISVVVTAYNVSLYIERCVKSILNQTYSDLELIVVDDGSTDNTKQICDELARQDKRLIVVHQKNSGNANARNTGIRTSKGEFITFVDGDDYVKSNMYESMLKEMVNPDVSIVVCGIERTNVDGTIQIAKVDKNCRLSKEEALLDFFSWKGSVGPSACNKVFRRNMFEKIRFNDNVIHEDTDVMPKLIDAATCVAVVNQAYYCYIKRSNSASTSKEFSLRGYHILDSMKEYRNMCKQKYASILPEFDFYELITTYEMYLNLMGCIDSKKYKKQAISLRYHMAKGVAVCTKYKEIRKKNADNMKVILVKAVLGTQLTKVLFHIE